MKRKHLFTYFVLAIVIATSMIIYSCQKEQTGIDKTENQTEQSFKDTQLEKRIIAFRDKIDLIRENPTLKSGSDPMNVDSAVWYIEATSNLTYGDASFETEEFIVDSAFIEVPVTNGQILWADVQAAYDQVIDSLAEHNANIGANEKQLIVADISLKESDNNSATFEVTSGFGTDGTTGFGNDYPWYWGWELGRCDGSGLGVGADAADKIAYLANMLIPVPTGNSYYTDVEYRYVYPWDYTDNNGDPMLFTDFQEYTLNHQCLSTADIAGYKSNLMYIGTQETPSGKSLIRYSLFDMTIFDLCEDPWPPHDCWYMEHHANIKYAIWHISSDPPEEF
ncbi:MAG: hypothetical protein H8E34_01115 [Bacteroidetes bacterium]|nr:hypothetical protein [Bacteroidota bacterium]MBL6944894.1 hypothetical protein [Bacteroidales bacterium]